MMADFKSLINATSAPLRVTLSTGEVIEIAPFSLAHVAPEALPVQTEHLAAPPRPLNGTNSELQTARAAQNGTAFAPLPREAA
jgi:hypothetical protein